MPVLSVVPSPWTRDDELHERLAAECFTAGRLAPAAEVQTYSPYTALRWLELVEQAGHDEKLATLRARVQAERERMGDLAYYRAVATRVDSIKGLTYGEYLDSIYWAMARGFALRRAAGRCALCNVGERLNVHHRTYERVRFERLDDLTVLCRGCHANHHRVAA